MTILELLNESARILRDHAIENPRLEAELLMAHLLHLTREELYLQFGREPKENEKEELDRLIKRRLSGEPLQYILGRQEFWSINFRVDPRVLIPRPETELLVERALSVLSKFPQGSTPKILEIGTGSGAVVVSLANEMKGLFCVATDIALDGLRLARENAMTAGVLPGIRFVQGDLFTPFRPPGREGLFDLILSNPPYIEDSRIARLPREVKDYEPLIALRGGENGLAYHRQIVSQAPPYLRPGGWLLLEIGEGQCEPVSNLIERTGDFEPPHCHLDLSGIERVIEAQRRGAGRREREFPRRREF
jgi:release factor glutamine methyltransferase